MNPYPFDNWEVLRSTFGEDGEVFEVTALDLGNSEWSTFLGAVREFFPEHSFSLDREPTDPPRNIGVVRKMSGPYVPMFLALFHGVEFACHFFADDEIQIDLDPRQIRNEHQLDGLFQVMSWLGELVHRDVILTKECQRSPVLLRYDHKLSKIVPGPTNEI